MLANSSVEVDVFIADLIREKAEIKISIKGDRLMELFRKPCALILAPILRGTGPVPREITLPREDRFLKVIHN